MVCLFVTRWYDRVAASATRGDAALEQKNGPRPGKLKPTKS